MAVYTAGVGMRAKQLYAPPLIFPGAVLSISQLSPPSAGSLFRISGWNFQDDNQDFAGSTPLPTSLGGVSVEVNGQAVPLLSVTPSEIVAQLPFTTAAGTTTFAVDLGGGKQIAPTAQVKDFAPEVLAYPNTGDAAAFHAGTSIHTDYQHPASAGEVLEMYGIGLGAVSPAVDTGMPGPSNPPADAIAVPPVTIGGLEATVTFAGLAPGLVGIDQVNVVVPSGLKSGAQNVVWSDEGQLRYNLIIWVQ